MDAKEVLSVLPYKKPFLFVDTLHQLSADGVEGSFTFRKDLDFYKGHFKNLPVTPGVILTECCAQIGLVCLGVFLLCENTTIDNTIGVALSSSNMQFYLPVYPGETVRVVSEKEYFRFGKLKCKVSMFNSENQLVCKGVLAGMLKDQKDV